MATEINTKNALKEYITITCIIIGVFEAVLQWIIGKFLDNITTMVYGNIIMRFTGFLPIILLIYILARRFANEHKKNSDRIMHLEKLKIANEISISMVMSALDNIFQNDENMHSITHKQIFIRKFKKSFMYAPIDGIDTPEKKKLIEDFLENMEQIQKNLLDESN